MSLGLRHYARREKVRRGERPPAHTPLYALALDVLIYPIAIAAPLALVPQVWHLYSTHDVSGLSLPTWAILAVLNVTWILYGKAHRERPVVITNVALCLLNSAVAVGIVLYQ